MVVRIHIYLILMLAYMYAIGKIEMYLDMYVFVLLHETAHILVATLLKMKVYEINLLPVGVNMRYEGEKENTKELLIAIAGPLSSFIITMITRNHKVKMINLVICIINMIPLKPFDGGRILECILKKFIKKEECEKVEKWIRKIVISLLVILSIYIFIKTKEYYIIIFIIYVIGIVKEDANYLQTD